MLIDLCLKLLDCVVCELTSESPSKTLNNIWSSGTGSLVLPFSLRHLSVFSMNNYLNSRYNLWSDASVIDHCYIVQLKREDNIHCFLFVAVYPLKYWSCGVFLWIENDNRLSMLWDRLHKFRWRYSACLFAQWIDQSPLVFGRSKNFEMHIRTWSGLSLYACRNGNICYLPNLMGNLIFSGMLSIFECILCFILRLDDEKYIFFTDRL